MQLYVEHYHGHDKEHHHQDDYHEHDQELYEKHYEHDKVKDKVKDNRH